MRTANLSEIKSDSSKRHQYLDGFVHGTSGLGKRLPTFEVESYELGYEHGSQGKMEFYFEVSETDCPKRQSKPPTRQKKKKKYD